MTTELKPCPHCGSEAHFHETSAGGHYIECSNQLCLATSIIRYAHGDDPKPLLAETWNRRTEQANEPQIEWVNRIEMEDLMRAWLKEHGWCQEHAEEISSAWAGRFALLYNGAFHKGMEVAKREQANQPHPDADDIAWDARVKALEDAAQVADKCVMASEAASKIRNMKGYQPTEQASKQQVAEASAPPRKCWRCGGSGQVEDYPFSKFCDTCCGMGYTIAPAPNDN